MKLSRIQAAAEKMGDFYLYYNKYHGTGTTYLVGTSEFDNKYILAMAEKHGSGLPSPLTGEVLQRLNSMADGAKASDKIMVFSWTNNKFRFINAHEVRRVTPLQSEMRNSVGRKR